MRVFAASLAALALASAMTACLIAYSDYDNRFQATESTGNDAGDASAGATIVTEDASVLSLAVTDAQIFYGVGGVIKAANLDGTNASVWWPGTGTGTVDAIVTDGSAWIAWTSGNRLWKSSTSSSSAAATVPDVTIGSYPKLAADATHFAWILEGQGPVGGVQTWSDGTTTLLTASQSAATHDVAVDQLGVTILGSAPLGVARFAFDGGESCTVGAGIASNTTALHAIATGSAGTPFYAISSASPNPLYDRASPCDPQSTATSGPSASGVASDGVGFYWLTQDLEVCGPALDASSCAQLVGGAPLAMAVDASHVYVALGSAIVRAPKP